jgi:antirestriction protein ArdC
MQDKDARSRQPPFAPGAGDNRQTENRTSLYDEVTEQIISDFEAGRLLWVQPWGSTATACPVLPRNALTVR